MCQGFAIFLNAMKSCRTIFERAKKKKDNHRNMPHSKNILGNPKFADTCLLQLYMAQSNKFPPSVSY